MSPILHALKVSRKLLNLAHDKVILT